MTDMRKKETALAILEKAYGITARINGLEYVANHLTRYHKQLMRDGVRLSPRTQQHHRERLNELYHMIAEYEHKKQCIINVINSIIETTRLEAGSREYLTLRYIEGMPHAEIAEQMYISYDHLKRKRKKALTLFCDALEAAHDDDVQTLNKMISEHEEEQ